MVFPTDDSGWLAAVVTQLAVLSAGFRAFFWLGAMNAVASIATWLGFLSGAAIGIGTQGWPAQALHAHEMIHGTVVAAIAGFLLTAVPNWCGTTPLRGAPIGALLVIWGAGRMALAAGDVLPRLSVAMLDGAFLPALAFAVGVPIVRSGKLRNVAVVAVLLALAVANGAMHAGLARTDSQLMRLGIYGSVYLVVLLMLIISGRVVPLFTQNALRADRPDFRVRSAPWVRWVGGCAIAAALATCGLDLLFPSLSVSGPVALLAALLLLVRQWSWRPGQVLGRPMLWILHAGHAWIAVGFACHAAVKFSAALSSTAALHAFTAGAMGALILGMMTRVSLGHTGRPVQASRLTLLAFVAVLGAAFVRVFGPLVFSPSAQLSVIMASGAAFSAAYLIFAVEFAPILWKPRIDTQATATGSPA